MTNPIARTAMPHSSRAEAVPFDPGRALRKALGQFATGVAIATARDRAGRRAGVTINSFASASLAPPLVLWSLGAASSNRDVFEDAGLHAINVLAVEQAWLARRFARPAPDRFAGVACRQDAAGAITIDGALAQFVCRVRARHPVGDHVLFVCEVVRHCSGGGAPLLFHASGYRGLGPAIAEPTPPRRSEAPRAA